MLQAPFCRGTMPLFAFYQSGFHTLISMEKKHVESCHRYR